LPIPSQPISHTLLFFDIICAIISGVAKAETILQRMRNNPNDIRFTDLVKVCDHYFGTPRQKGSH